MVKHVPYLFFVCFQIKKDGSGWIEGISGWLSGVLKLDIFLCLQMDQMDDDEWNYCLDILPQPSPLSLILFTGPGLVVFFV